MISLAGIERPAPRTSILIGALDLHQNRWRARWRGVQVNLTSTEFTIVSSLAIRPGNLTYWRIYEIARGGRFHVGYGGDDPRGAVATHIKRIRAKFRAIDPDFDRIQNCWKFGYRWRETAGEARS